MENQDFRMQDEKMWEAIERSHRRGKILGGILLIVIGSLFLAREMGVIFPNWLFSWKMLLIAIGVVVMIKHRFRTMKGLILILIGGAFMMSDVCPDVRIQPFIWPVLIILVGLIVIFKPRKRFNHRHWARYNRHHEKWSRYKQQHCFDVFETTNDKEDFVD